MPKSFLFTHKRYDCGEGPTTSGCLDLNVEEEEEEENPLQDLSTPRENSSRSSTGSNFVSSCSSSSSGHCSASEDESYSPSTRLAKVIGNLNKMSHNQRQPYPVHPVTPKKRRYHPPTATSTTTLRYCESAPELYIKEEPITLSPSNNLHATFKSLVVSPEDEPCGVQQLLHHSIGHRGNGLHSSSYQIKLISPPPGGTLSHHHPLYLTKTLHQTSPASSPLQFIIAAAEQQQAEEERVFIEGSRSEESQPSGKHKHLDEHEDSSQAQDQPVNLSVKKVDLFNLTQLAEVSIAAAKREMSLRSSNVGNITSPSTTSPSNNSLKPTITIPQNSICSTLAAAPPINNENKVGNSTSTHHPTGRNDTKKTDSCKKMVMLKSKPKYDKSGIGGTGSKIPPPPPLYRQHHNNHGKAHNLSSSSELPSLSSANTKVLTPSSSMALSSSSNNSARHRCVECGKGFSTLSNLARHRQTHRSLSDASAVKKCPHCDKVYVSMPAFSMHLRTHNQGCKCPYCGKGFSRPWLLQGHIRTHTGEKPFKCGICSKAFADKSNLRAHTQTHSTEKPFVCARCGKPFALKSYLCKHIESSCMKSNRPSGPSSSTNGKGSDVGGGSATVSTAINNSSSSSSSFTRASSSLVSSSAATGGMGTSALSTSNRDKTKRTVIAAATSSSCSPTLVTKTTNASASISTPSTSSSRSNNNSLHRPSFRAATTNGDGKNNGNGGCRSNKSNNSNGSRNGASPKKVVSASTFFIAPTLQRI